MQCTVCKTPITGSKHKKYCDACRLAVRDTNKSKRYGRSKAENKAFKSEGRGPIDPKWLSRNYSEDQVHKDSM